MIDPHRQAALVRIKKELMVPQENLASRIAELQEGILKEKQSLEDELNNVTQSQILQARKAMATLSHSTQNLELLKTNFASIVSSVNISQQGIPEYDVLRMVHSTRANIREVRRWIERFFNLEVELEELYEKISNGDVLEAYKTIAELSSFKLAVHTNLLKAGTKAGVAGNPFNPYFTKIDCVTDTLVKRIEHIFSNVLQYFSPDSLPAQQEQVFAAIQVMMEETEAPLLTMPEAPASSRISKTSVMPCLLVAVEQTWAELMRDAKTLSQRLTGMTAFVETMTIWEFDLVPAFPTDYSLKPWYSRLYHTKLVSFITDHISHPDAVAKLSSEEQMSVVHWIERYVNALESLEINFEKGMVSAQDLQELQHISGVFQGDAVEKMKGWVTTYASRHLEFLLQDCVERDPDDGTLYTMGPVEIFKFLQHQLKSMSSVSPPGVILDLAGCCVEGIRYPLFAALPFFVMSLLLFPLSFTLVSLLAYLGALMSPMSPRTRCLLRRPRVSACFFVFFPLPHLLAP